MSALSSPASPQMGTLTLTSEPIGPIAAWETLSQTISALLGSGWSDPTAIVGAGEALNRRECKPPHRSGCDGAGDRDPVPDPAQ